MDCWQGRITMGCCLITIFYSSMVLGTNTTMCYAPRDQSSDGAKFVNCTCSEPPPPLPPLLCPPLVVNCTVYTTTVFPTTEEATTMTSSNNVTTEQIGTTMEGGTTRSATTSDLTETDTVTDGLTSSTMAMTSSTHSHTAQTTTASRTVSGSTDEPPTSENTATETPILTTKKVKVTAVPVEEEEGNVWTAELIGAIVGVFAGLVILIVILCAVYVKLRRANDEPQKDTPLDTITKSGNNQPKWSMPAVTAPYPRQQVARHARQNIYQEINTDPFHEQDKHSHVETLADIQDYEAAIFRTSGGHHISLPRSQYARPMTVENPVFYEGAPARQDVHSTDAMAFTNPLYRSSAHAHNVAPSRDVINQVQNHDYSSVYNNRLAPQHGRSRDLSRNHEEQYDRLQRVYGDNFSDGNTNTFTSSNFMSF